jgi:Protein of unknown function (DUF1217)
MTTTTSTYLTVTNHLAKMQAMTAADPTTKTASAYYTANIGKVTSVDDFVGNYRLLSYALDAYGLGDQIHSTALIKQVLEGGVANQNSLGNTLPKWTAFAKAFNFAAGGAASITTASAVATTEGNYVEQQLETNQGDQDVGVQLALYFNRVAPTVTSAYGILADKNLLEAVETIFGLPTAFSAGNIDTQAKILGNLLDVSDLQDPAKLSRLTERFTAAYDSTYNSPTSTSSLTVTGSSSSEAATSPAAGALAVLSGIVSSNASYSGTFFSASLLQSLQNFTLGG